MAFVAKMPPTAYSGGRLTSLNLANSLAECGVQVELLTNVYPRMALEYRRFGKLKIRVVNLNTLPTLTGFDFVVCVPHLGNQEMLASWARKVEADSANLVLLNFETPNWFNSLVPAFERDAGEWAGWVFLAQRAQHIISLSREGTKFAREFYGSVGARFSEVYPSINSRLADRATRRSKRKEIIMISRVDHHKGLSYLPYLFSRKLSGFEVRVYLGNKGPEPALASELARSAASVGMRLKFRSAIVGERKFSAISRARFLFFPTDFEGFGIPPLEAGYMGTQVVCSDLPVLREFGGNFFHYFPNSNPEVIPDVAKRAVIEPDSELLRKQFRPMGAHSRSGQELLDVLNGRPTARP